MTPPLSEKVKRNWGSSWEEWKSSNFTLKKNKIVAYSAFTSWVLDGETMETMTDFIFLGSKICTHETKIHLLIGRRAMTNLDSILKNRDITLTTKLCLIKTGFSIMNGCESWIIKKAEHWRSDAFELWCWRRLLRVPWTARRSNQSILKEISPGCSLEGLMLKLKLQYFGHLIWRADSMQKTLILRKIEGGRRRGWQMRWLDGIISWMDMSLSKLLELVVDRETWCAIAHGVTKCWTQLRNWTEDYNPGKWGILHKAGILFIFVKVGR